MDSPLLYSHVFDCYVFYCVAYVYKDNEDQSKFIGFNRMDGTQS